MHIFRGTPEKYKEKMALYINDSSARMREVHKVEPGEVYVAYRVGGGLSDRYLFEVHDPEILGYSGFILTESEFTSSPLLKFENVADKNFDITKLSKGNFKQLRSFIGIKEPILEEVADNFVNVQVPKEGDFNSEMTDEERMELDAIVGQIDTDLNLLDCFDEIKSGETKKAIIEVVDFVSKIEEGFDEDWSLSLFKEGDNRGVFCHTVMGTLYSYEKLGNPALIKTAIMFCLSELTKYE